jgi:hypothetical protein
MKIESLRSTTRQVNDTPSKQRNSSCKIKSMNNLWSQVILNKALTRFRNNVKAYCDVIDVLHKVSLIANTSFLLNLAVWNVILKSFKHLLQ